MERGVCLDTRSPQTLLQSSPKDDKKPKKAADDNDDNDGEGGGGHGGPSTSPLPIPALRYGDEL